MVAYYNEINSKKAAALRQLIADGFIANGDVDERSIVDVRPSELTKYTQCHFFAGVGIWSIALRLAGWPDDRPVWTGSEPCQPFSEAGKKLGRDDERYLRWAWHHLIEHGKRSEVPVYGEQVARGDGLTWLDHLSSDMEGINHTVRAFDLCAAGFGAPHIRQRLFWVADPNGKRQSASLHRSGETTGEGESRARSAADRCGDVGRVEHTSGIGRQWRETPPSRNDDGRPPPQRAEGQHGPCLAGAHWLSEHCPRPTNGFWRDADWLGCRDEFWRPVAPGAFVLAHGYLERTGLLNAAGDGIVAQVAASFIEATMT